MPSLEYPQANVEYKLQKVTLGVGGKEALLPLPRESPVIDRIHTDSDDFTSPGETESEKFASSSSYEPGSSKDGSDSEQEIALAIINKEPYVPLTEEQNSSVESEEAVSVVILASKMRHLE